jgi:two-component system response regulator HupR/HoxA
MDKRTVLFVDDEERLLASLRRGLLDEPYNALFAGSGKEALKILEQQEVHVLVTDMRMPEMGGLELLREVKQKYPHVVRMVLSGYTQVTTVLTAVNQGEVFRYITKPWKLEEEFKPTIREAIEYYDFQSTRRGSAGQTQPHDSGDPVRVGQAAGGGEVDGR